MLSERLGGYPFERLGLALLAFGLALALSLSLAGLPQALAPPWYAQAVAVAGLLGLPLSWAGLGWLLMLALQIAVFGLLPQAGADELGLAVTRSCEIALGVVLLRSWGLRLRQRLTPLEWLQVLALGTLVPSLLGAAVGLLPALLQPAPVGVLGVDALLAWTGHLAGGLAAMPLALLLLGRGTSLRTSLSHPETWVGVLAVVGVSLVALTSLQMPYVFVALSLGLLGLWLGLAATAVATLLVSALLAYAQGVGLLVLPAGASSWSAWTGVLPLVALWLPPQLLAAAVEQLRVQQRRVTAYYEHTPVMLASLDEQLRLRAGSEALLRWLGQARVRALGQPLNELLGLNESQTKRLRRYLDELPAEEPRRGAELRLNAEHAPPERHALRLRALRLGLPDETGYELVVEDLSEQVQMQAALQRTAEQLEAARRDALTELPLRAGFLDDLEQALARASFTHRRLAVVFVDVDELKRVNDQHGHAAGDALLQALGQRLRSHLRPGDLAGRLGGDEFALVLGDVQPDADPLALADRVLAALEGPVRQSAPALMLSVSVGVALYPDHGLEAEVLLRHADAAMYRAKGGPARARRTAS